jgi:hypothetical protein
VRQLFLVLAEQAVKLIGAITSVTELHKIRLNQREEPVAVLVELLQLAVLAKQETREPRVVPD